MSLGAICDLIADTGAELEAASVVKFGFHLASEAQENVALLAPMVGSIARRILDHAYPNWAEILRAPQRDTGLSGMLRGFDISPIRNPKRELGDMHGYRQLVERNGWRLAPEFC